MERLHHVIVSPLIQTNDPLFGLTPCREHQNKERRLADPHTLADLQTIHFGQVQVHPQSPAISLVLSFFMCMGMAGGVVHFLRGCTGLFHCTPTPTQKMNNTQWQGKNCKRIYIPIYYLLTLPVKFEEIRKEL